MINARIGRSPAAARMVKAGRAFEEQARLKREWEEVTRLKREEERSRLAAPPPPPEPEPEPELLPTRLGNVTDPRCRRIVVEVAAKHALDVDELLSDVRARTLTPARHEIAYRCVAETAWSLSEIGRMLHRDHSTIGYSVMMHHHRTGAPLPRGMVWLTSSKVRSKASQSSHARKALRRRVDVLRNALDRIAGEIGRIEALLAQENAPNGTIHAADASGGASPEAPPPGENPQGDRPEAPRQPPDR